MDFKTLLIGLNSLKSRGFERFKRKQPGLHLWIHRSFTFDSHETGFPKTILYANGSTGRFDWCKIIDDEDKVFTIQIGALLVLEDNGTKKMIWIGFNTKPEVLSNRFVKEAFPALKYSYLQRTKQFEIKVGFVDEIYQPAMVVALDMDPRSFFVQNYDLRKEVLHKHVDLLL
jgi:hypothetical protein